MTDLESTFGEEFAQDYKQKVAQRREERQSVDDDILSEVAHQAINEDKFKDGDPHFTVTSEAGVDHDVLLMSLPQIEGKSVFSYVNELDTGAVTCPLDYMGDWMSCLFNDPDDLKQMTEGDYYIIIGNMDTWENDKGEVNDQVSPVRAVLSLPEAEELANEGLSGINDDQGEAEDDTEDSDDGGSVFGGGDDDGEDEIQEAGPSYDEVAEVVEDLADKESAVWEIEEGSDRHEKVTKVAMNRLDADGDYLEEVAEMAFQRVEEEQEDDEDEEDEEENLFG